MLCEYGCNQNANYQFNNGKWCCSESNTKCPEMIEKRKTSFLRNVESLKILCPHCNKKYSKSGMKHHIKCCKRDIKCMYCNKKIKHNGKFCDRTCAGFYNNSTSKKLLLRYGNKCYISFCTICGKTSKSKNKKHCSDCRTEYNYLKNVSDWLSGKISGSSKTGYREFVKRYMVEKANHKCEKCGWDIICKYSKKCPLHLHHIDGNKLYNNPINLKVLCPNCHWLTDNFAGRNNNNKG